MSSQVVRIGLYGCATLAGSGTAVVIDEFSTSGAYVKNWSLPVLTNPCVMSGTSTTEGYTTLSPDGTAVVFACYSAVPGTASGACVNDVESSTAAFKNREVKNSNIDVGCLLASGPLSHGARPSWCRTTYRAEHVPAIAFLRPAWRSDLEHVHQEGYRALHCRDGRNRHVDNRSDGKHHWLALRDDQRHRLLGRW